ncbi:MAG: VWA domain-containing protein [Planctomycetota bacterium]|nr:VWA domain-containing protein [Planctomycetota bacterium]
MNWALHPPPWWPWLAAVPILCLMAALRRRRAAAAIRRDFGRRASALLGRPAWGRARGAAAAAALGLFVLAMLRPVSPGRDAQLAPDVVLCVDVSRSMGAGDVAPTRFEAVRSHARALLEDAVGSRFALVAFAGDAQVVAPLTADRGAVSWLLAELEPGVARRGGTDLGAAVQAAR